VSAARSDLFAALGPPEEKFDVVLLNPPFYLGAPGNKAECAWKGGNNYDFIRRFISEAWKFMTPEGRIIFVVSSDMDVAALRSMFRNESYLLNCLQRRRVMFEELFIFEALHES
jgi:methylase of polypeptide subunit release factors